MSIQKFGLITVSSLNMHRQILDISDSLHLKLKKFAVKNGGIKDQPIKRDAIEFSVFLAQRK
jgi:hypothetical protein